MVPGVPQLRPWFIGIALAFAACADSPPEAKQEQQTVTNTEKACELLSQKIHLLIIDPFPPGKRDPRGIHAAIWEQVEDGVAAPPTKRPLTLVSYECGLTTRGHIEPLAVGDPLPDMPLFLEPDLHVDVPLEPTYMRAWDAVPRRWREVIDT